MTIEAYIRSSLETFGLNDAMFADILLESGVNLSDDYDASVQESVGKAMASAIERISMMPKLSNVSENGFSMSWTYEDLGKYYLWLCRRWHVTPNADTVASMGISTITDRTSKW